MASCKLSAGLSSEDCSQRFFEPGIKKSRIWIGNWDDITVNVSSSTGVVESLTFATYAKLYGVEGLKDANSWNEEFVEEVTGGRYYNQTGVVKSINTDATTRSTIESYAGVSTILIMQEKNGRFILLGETGGVQMTLNTNGSGAAAGDEVGDLINFTGTNNGKARHFFITNEATTLALLESYEEL